MISIQELLPSKSRYAAHVAHALLVLIPLWLSAKEGKKWKRLDYYFFSVIIVPIIQSAVSSPTMLYITIRLPIWGRSVVDQNLDNS